MKTHRQEQLPTIDALLLVTAMGGDGTSTATGDDSNVFEASGKLKLAIPMGSIEGEGRVFNKYNAYGSCGFQLNNLVTGLPVSPEQKLDLWAKHHGEQCVPLATGKK